MAAVRLRKAFRYPDDLDDDQDHLDEQQQEQLIEQLQRQNDTRNAQYHLIFTTIPLLATLPFLSTLFSSSSMALLSLLSILSLLTSAYTMRLAPLRPDHKGKRAVTASTQRRDRIHAALVPGNALLVLVLGVSGWAMRDSGTGAGAGMGIGILFFIPGVLLGVVLIAQRTMLSVDISTLKQLQYGYKGA
ncbi:Uncharacterized protein PECH_008863 [Penicillium ucsense]|uniref:Uncharacterized protein n=1 Tax=Penicillium ucsense TaxID=2839758 RepID=A0A8J8W1U1_9EURO|nr:Uncharacterized protein PECM_008437 [Penicillium ucsense]KAF7733859.1 Uncharacterized protein PECH_008863 [Penicillium ucsense]